MSILELCAIKSNLVQGTRTATATRRRNARNIYKYWFVHNYLLVWCSFS